MKLKLVYLLAVVVAVVSCQNSTVSPTIEYVNVWEDEMGQTHMSVCELDGFSLQSFSSSGKQYVSTKDAPTKRYVFNISPKTYFGDWHSAPSLQWVVTIAGSWYVRTTDGAKVNLPAGAILFNADVNAKVGHQSGVSQKYESSRVIVVQVTELPKNTTTTRKCSAGGYFKCDIKPNTEVVFSPPTYQF